MGMGCESVDCGLWTGLGLGLRLALALLLVEVDAGQALRKRCVFAVSGGDGADLRVWPCLFGACSGQFGAVWGCLGACFESPQRPPASTRRPAPELTLVLTLGG